MTERKPFVMIPKTVAKDEDLSAQAKLVYLALATFVDDQTKEGKPSRKRIASRAGVSTSRMTKYLNELEEKGYVTSEAQFSKYDGSRMSNKYRLNDV